jgi:hypothetical protein
MSGALKAFFVFLFVIFGVIGFITVMAFVTENNAPAASVVGNATAYLSNSSVVNHTMAFQQNVTAQATTALLPLPMLAMIFAIGAAVMLFLLVIRRR